MKSFENHIHPEKEEQLRQTKIDVENKVKKILKLAMGMHGSKEGRKEIINLVEDFHQQYESLYSLYEDLRGEAKNINGRDDGSSTPSDSEVYYSPIDFTHRNSREIEDVEDTILKDILTSSSEIKEIDNFFKDLIVQDEEPRNLTQRSVQARDLEGEVARLNFEIRTIHSQKKHWEQQVECKVNEAMQMKDRISRLKDRVVELECTCKDKECLQHELEEKLSSETKERSIEVNDLVDQVDSLHQELVSVTTQKAGLELELNRKSGEMLENHVKDLKHDIHGNLEEQIARISQESRQSMAEKQELLRKMSKIQTSLLLTERKLSAQEKKLKLSEEGFSGKVRTLNQKAKNQDTKLEALYKEKNSLQVELRALRKDKERLIMELEKEKQESTLMKSKMERKNNELSTKISNQQKTLLELGDVINKLRVDNIKAHPNFQLMEAKVEEVAEEFKKQFEDKYRAMGRRIRAAEKMLVDYREWYLNTKEAYNQENKAEQEKIEMGLRNIKDMSITANDVLISLDMVDLKFEECNASFLNRISKTSCEVKYAKEWVRRKNRAMLQVKHDLDDLLCQLDDKEAEVLEFRERVWKLENKMREAEKNMKEKDEGEKELREEKREAIRQLCVWIDYHRCRTDYYKKMMKRMPEMNARRRSIS